MRLYELVDLTRTFVSTGNDLHVNKVAVIVFDKQPNSTQYENKNKSSEGIEFVMADVVVKPIAPQHTFSKLTQRTNSLFTELLNNQLRNITTGV